MFDRVSIHKHDGPSYPSRVDIHEHRAPTEESLRLVEDLRERLAQSETSRFALSLGDGNHIEGCAISFSFFDNMKMVSFTLNGRQYTARIELRRTMPSDLHLLCEELGKAIAVELLSECRELHT